MQRNISVATPQTSNIPSKIFLWFTCHQSVDTSYYRVQTTTNLDDKLANINGSEDFVDNLDALSVGDHGVVFAGDVKVALIELSQSASQYAWVVPPVYLV